MKHNFPIGKSVNYFTINREITEAEKKAVMKLCVDAGIHFDSNDIIEQDEEYPRITVDTDGENGVTLTCTEATEDVSSERLLSLEEFKLFLKGQGDVKKLNLPFESTIVLNDSYSAYITKDEVKAGCVHLSHETIDEIYRESQLARKSKN